MTTSVPNPYRRALIARRNSSVPDQATLETCLDRSMAAFELGAWIGGCADQVYAELAELRGDAKAVACGVDGEFAQAINGEPEMVEADAWQVHWRNMR